jgi:8-amino-7-oxononanoate synthase
MNEDFLEKKLLERRQASALRTLKLSDGLIDFCSNDYLGIVKNNLIRHGIDKDLPHGSTGSRLLSGNYKLLEDTEKMIADFHEAPEGIIFNSGYDANVGLLSCVPQKGDVIVYDQLSHASIRDGIRLSFARSFSFLHNDMDDLGRKLSAVSKTQHATFVVTESVFSMDGDTAPLEEISILCAKHNARLIVDEAHATGIVGRKGEGLVQHLQLQQKCFARVHTFGKACGCHGAIVLGSTRLKQYLINFARPLIYSTALPPSCTNAIAASYTLFPFMSKEREHINTLLSIFKEGALRYAASAGHTPIQAVIIPDNEEVKKVAGYLQKHNFDIRAILYPTVPRGRERLRIVFHSYNTTTQVEQLIDLLKQRGD